MTTAATTPTTTEHPAGRATRIRQVIAGPRALGILAWVLAAAGLGMAVWTARSWSWWSAAWIWLGRWWMVPTAVLLLAAAIALGVLRARHPASPPRPTPEPGMEVMSALTPRSIVLGAVVLLGLGVTAAVLLLVNVSGTEPRDRLDAVRTAATLLVGTGGAAALLLAARRQRAAELALAVQHRTADATEHDAASRRITELYLKAVEQLGSDKAAVRHGGLYALERVAQDNSDQRQTVINVICAYLRSPYTPPPERPAARRTGLLPAARRGKAASRVAAGIAAARRTHLTPPAPTAGPEQARQEREVRLTAQRILTTHLCADPTRPPTSQPILGTGPRATTSTSPEPLSSTSTPLASPCDTPPSPRRSSSATRGSARRPSPTTRCSTTQPSPATRCSTKQPSQAPRGSARRPSPATRGSAERPSPATRGSRGDLHLRRVVQRSFLHPRRAVQRGDLRRRRGDEGSCVSGSIRQHMCVARGMDSGRSRRADRGAR